MDSAEPDDVFISYAHADNGIALGTSSPMGWVTALAANLNEGPNVFKKCIFIDHQLKPGDQFSDDLLVRVGQSRLLVLLLSQNYVDSQWCGKELEHFVRTHADDPEKPADVYVVEIFPFERLTSVPPIIQALRKRLIHAKFWYQPANAASPVLSGYPSPKDSGPEGAAYYWSVLNELRVAIDSRLRALRAAGVEARAAVARLGTVLLADTTEDLERQRMTVKLALEPEGIVVLPEGDYIGLTAQEFETAISADLERCDLFVQLLSPTVGRKGRGFAAPLPQLQFQRAQQARLPIMQWCEQLPVEGQIDDPEHARLFDTEFLRVTHLAGFKSEVVDRVRAERARRERVAAAAQAGPAVARAHRKLIFVDDLASVPDLSNRLRAIIREQHFEVRALPPSAPLGNNGVDVKEVLRLCRAGLTIYADRSKYATAYNRLVYFLNQVAENSLEVERWGVYLEQGTVASEFGIESDDVVAVDERGLGDFLGQL
ncbi:TIR protein [Candidatus Accumulibacter aalborgensis]|uniref:TIR protein n=1 Tax=Candidatus Accumulibacter aalborgensis TaxID=1860102 RepID=A0A1A8XKZ5_9PROT|nr:toll/interleukin-1 receptor domain-containing protein [Candidatus Accumulibacter aalborgensis]SBT05820.1 TIR protein [Candidatus Accumulibacter aalborgensis]